MPITTHSAKSGITKALRLIRLHGPSLGVPAPFRDSSIARISVNSLPSTLRRTTTPARSQTDTSPEASLSIPVPEAGLEEQATETAFKRGQFLARQEQWAQLFEEIEQADTSCQITPSGTPIAEVLAFGARSDVLNAVEHALSDGLRLSDPVTVEGIMSLERVRMDMKRSPLASACVAQAHLDIAWACQRQAATARTGKHLERAEAHLKRAQTLLAPLAAKPLQSTFISATKCALYTGLPDTPRAMADAYSTLISMAPKAPRPMRALGGHMLRHGGPQTLELEARRTAAMVENHWGAAGYTWVYFDVLTHSDIACETVDVQFFLDGFADIVEQAPHQEMINLLAAYCGLALTVRPMSDAARRVRTEISETTNWLIRNHLRELHPMIWAHAAEGFDNDAQVRSARRFSERGRATALRVIAELFRDEIASGHRIVFTDHGPQLVQG